MLGLIAVPAATAHRITANPYLALSLSALVALASLWLGITLAYAIPSLPPSSAIIGVAATAYLIALLATARERLSSRPRTTVRYASR